MIFPFLSLYPTLLFFFSYCGCFLSWHHAISMLYFICHIWKSFFNGLFFPCIQMVSVKTYLFILDYFNEMIASFSGCVVSGVIIMLCQLCTFTCAVPFISKHTFPFPCSFLILSYLPWLQSGGLQRYLMLIVHMKENLYEVWASGTDWASWGYSASLLRQLRQSIPQFLVSGDF